MADKRDLKNDKKSNTNWKDVSVLSLTMAICSLVRAQDRTITIRMLDSKTGQPITTSEIEVTIKASQTSAPTKGTSPIYVHPDESGVGEATFSITASDLAVYAPDGVWGYVNCDSLKDHGSWQKHFYSISKILASGIAAPNFCSKRKIVAKPGEFLFFVRSMTFWEKMKE